MSVFSDLFILSKKQIFESNLLFAGVSFVFALSISLRMWSTGMGHLPYQRRHKLNLFRNNSWFSSWVLVSWFTRIASLYGLWLIMFSFHLHISVFSQFQYFFYLMILVFFFHQWNDLRIIYKCWKWQYLSLIAMFVSVPLIALLNLNKPDDYDTFYLAKNNYKYEYVERELDRAKELGVEFSKAEIKNLKYNYSVETLKWKKIIQDKFENKETFWQIKDLIVFKIFIHNFTFKRYYWKYNPFYYGEIIFNSIDNYDTDYNEMQILLTIEILNEYRQILNPKFDMIAKDPSSLTFDERFKYDDTFHFIDSFPKNWTPVEAWEITGKKQNKPQSIDIGSVYNEKERISDMRLTVLSLITKLSNDKKYDKYTKIFSNGR